MCFEHETKRKLSKRKNKIKMENNGSITLSQRRKEEQAGGTEEQQHWEGLGCQK
jgi:hypothetical protein